MVLEVEVGEDGNADGLFAPENGSSTKVRVQLGFCFVVSRIPSAPRIRIRVGGCAYRRQPYIRAAPPSPTFVQRYFFCFRRTDRLVLVPDTSRIPSAFAMAGTPRYHHRLVSPQCPAGPGTASIPECFVRRIEILGALGVDLGRVFERRIWACGGAAACLFGALGRQRPSYAAFGLWSGIRFIRRKYTQSSRLRAWQSFPDWYYIGYYPLCPTVPIPRHSLLPNMSARGVRRLHPVIDPVQARSL
ncbi:hypothetical protein B0H16DRAFT_538593 [Mycena metata]|uniref:Uncharacterized protein n=1 Tax=Mycena metata TaxID=1033252 RepID=A0AAD7JC53_9AGAR|nr:hypothetical protein B0H16DRAFT_538593 [Mycena metata]